MEPNRKEHPVRMAGPRRQAGVTAIGFLFLAAVFGAIGFAALKVVPLYINKMRVSTVLEDVKEELDGSGKTPAGIRNALYSRFAVEGLEVPRDNVEISQGRDGYTLRIHNEARTTYIADLWFMVIIDEQVEIRR